MTKINAPLLSFTGGAIGELMAARLNVESYLTASSIMDNWMPYAQGPMRRRPPLEHVDGFPVPGKVGALFGFKFSISQNYAILANNGVFYFWINGGQLDIEAVTATIENGDFTLGGTGWTDTSETGSTAVAIGQEMVLQGDGANESSVEQSVTITETSATHILKFDVLHGPVNLRIGTSTSGTDILDFMTLDRGTHQIEFVPGVSPVFISWWHTDSADRIIDNISIMGAGPFTLAHPYADADLAEVQTDQEGDQVWFVREGYPTRVLERRGHRSWSLIYFEPPDGPFNNFNTDLKLTIKPDASLGPVQLTASKDLFTADDVRQLYELTFEGQYVEEKAAAENYYTRSVTIFGVGATSRTFDIEVSGTFVGTVTLERSIGNENDFEPVLVGAVGPKFTTASGPLTVNDTADIDNFTAFYRLAIYPGDYTSGTITMKLVHDGGSQKGVVRITNVVSATIANGEALTPLGIFVAGGTDLWKRGRWSANQGFPSVVAFGYGRLWLARNLNLWSSVSDDFFSFQGGADTNLSIDARVNSRTSDGVRWMAFLDFLTVGTRAEEFVVLSANPTDPIGPDSIQILLQSEEGGARVPSQTGGGSVLYVHKSRRRLMQFTHNPRALSEESFISVDLNRLHPEINQNGIKKIAVQTEPERRIYCILNDGSCNALLFRREEEIAAWHVVSSNKVPTLFEDVLVLPDNDQDTVYFAVRRFLDGAWTRSIERLGTEIVINDEDYYHLDAALSTTIDRRDAFVTPGAVTGTGISFTSEPGVWVSGDVGKVLWVNGGRATITGFTSAAVITGDILFDLTSVKPAAFGLHGLATETTAISGLDHLNGQEVFAWADQNLMGPFTPVSGNITLPTAASRTHVGINLISDWLSYKLAFGAQKGTALGQKKSVHQFVILTKRTAEPIKYGPDFDDLKPVIFQSSSPVMGAPQPLITGETLVSFHGGYDTDPRIALRVDTPGPAEIVALVPHIQEYDR